MRLLPTTRYSVKTCLNSTLLRPPIAFVVDTCLPRHLACISLRPSCAQFRRTFALSSRSLQQLTPRTDHDRKPEEKTKPGANERLQAIRAEKIWTIPNALTVSRILSCPILCYAILHDNFYAATGLLVYAGLTDLVCVQFSYFGPRCHSSTPPCHALRPMVTWHGSTTWVLFSARSLTPRRTRR